MNEKASSDPAAEFPSLWYDIVTRWTTGNDPAFPAISAGRRGVVRQLRPVTLVGSIAVFTVPTPWAKSEVEDHLAMPIQDVLHQELGQPISISVSVQANPPEPQRPTQDFTNPSGSSNPSEHANSSNPRDPRDSRDLRGSGPGTHTGPEQFPQPTPDADAAAQHASYYEARRGDDVEPSPTPPAWQHLANPTTASSRPGTDSTHSPARRVIRTPGTQEPVRDDETMLNRKYTFDSFVIGSSNQFAHAACCAVAEAPARAYNPLFIWGESGLGKTHLLHAIGHYARELQPNMRVQYVSSEELTNNFINSIASNTREAFKRRYRNLDMLIVDDIQFLQGKESTQEEFFHTFNALHQANKQIVLSSDRPPRQLTTLEDRLRTRFEGGLITDVQTPDLDTRIAILTKKAHLENKVLPEDVATFIATRYETSIRELEGALIRVTAYCSLSRVPVSVEAAEVALRNNMPTGGDVVISAQSIIETVADYYTLTTEELLGKGRSRKVAHARQVAIYLCRELTDLSLPKLGVEFGGRDHSTVLYAERRIRESLNEDRKTFDDVQHLTQKVKSHS
ncbi:chromosomal replication initiator protein DnaA [Corynebacterium heidelbergense]|uniref:Chromosomal replication initiator protein DnaA n=1 Tax=Corynebacterium heidelbergense TaxID=2055947 RepID=A0A364V891_9CORY|nr:chromosomal replication initiator protein DnaA [Corynebacterium heidelbergense]